MKSTIMHLMSLFLILAFSASCGKGGDSGGGSSNASNPVTNPSVVGSAAHTELVNWLNAAETTSGMRAYYVKKSGSMNGWTEREICQPIGGINIPGCLQLTSCFVSSSNIAIGLGSTVFDGLRAKDCTLSGAFHTKSSDATLREAILGKTSGRAILKDRTVKSGSIYTVYFAQYEGSTVVSGAAQINTSLPSVLNPTLIEENSQRTKTFYLPY